MNQLPGNAFAPAFYGYLTDMGIGVKPISVTDGGVITFGPIDSPQQAMGPLLYLRQFHPKGLEGYFRDKAAGTRPTIEFDGSSTFGTERLELASVMDKAAGFRISRKFQDAGILKKASSLAEKAEELRGREDKKLADMFLMSAVLYINLGGYKNTHTAAEMLHSATNRYFWEKSPVKAAIVEEMAGRVHDYLKILLNEAESEDAEATGPAAELKESLASVRGNEISYIIDKERDDTYAQAANRWFRAVINNSIPAHHFRTAIERGIWNSWQTDYKTYMGELLGLYGNAHLKTLDAISPPDAFWNEVAAYLKSSDDISFPEISAEFSPSEANFFLAESALRTLFYTLYSDDSDDCWTSPALGRNRQSARCL